ncbi:hypothetical protein [Bacillus alveayuensis]|nr:hypothetical protein [Bacillus alveayuensis]
MPFDLLVAIFAIFILRELIKTKNELIELKEYVKKFLDNERS